MPHVTTYTETMIRVEVIKIQARTLIKKLLGLVRKVSSTTLDKINTIIDDKVIRVLHIYALDSNNNCYIQLNLYFDWDEYNTQINLGNEKIGIDDSWDDGVASEISEFIESFTRMSIKIGNTLNVECRVSFMDNVDYEEYGFTKGEEIIHSTKEKLMCKTRIYDLPELKIEQFAIKDEQIE